MTHRPDLGDYLMMTYAWVLWVCAFGTITVTMTWTDRRTQAKYEYVVKGLL